MVVKDGKKNNQHGFLNETVRLRLKTRTKTLVTKITTLHRLCCAARDMGPGQEHPTGPRAYFLLLRCPLGPIHPSLVLYPVKMHLKSGQSTQAPEISRGLLCSDPPLPLASSSLGPTGKLDQPAPKDREFPQKLSKDRNEGEKKARKGEGRKKESPCIHPTPTFPIFSADSVKSETHRA